jgi:enoyl-CoA hydratase/carnithine racemase
MLELNLGPGTRRLDFLRLLGPRSPNPCKRSMRVIKQQLTAAARQTLAEATQHAREVAICRGTEDFKEGVAHFVENGAPHFTRK